MLGFELWGTWSSRSHFSARSCNIYIDNVMIPHVIEKKKKKKNLTRFEHYILCFGSCNISPTSTSGGLIVARKERSTVDPVWCISNLTSSPSRGLASMHVHVIPTLFPFKENALSCREKDHARPSRFSKESFMELSLCRIIQRPLI